MNYLRYATTLANVVLILTNIALLLWIKREQRLLDVKRHDFLNLIRGATP